MLTGLLTTLNTDSNLKAFAKLLRTPYQKLSIARSRVMQVDAYFFGSLLGVYFSLLFFSFVDLYSSVGFLSALSSGLVSL